MRAPRRAAVRFCCCLFSHVAVAKNISLDRLSGTECEDREEDRGSKKGAKEETMMTMTTIFGFSDRPNAQATATEELRTNIN